MNHVTTTTAPANGASTAQELFALTDEQILEIEPVDDAAAPVEQPILAVPPVYSVKEKSSGDNGHPRHTAQASTSDKSAQAGVPALQDPPAWLARQMKDPWAGEEARELWEGVLRAQAEAAEYRAAIASPDEAKSLKEIYPRGVEQARSAAERARALDEFDAAYFGAAGKSTEEITAARTALAQKLLKEDPATFREMVFAGLKALSEQAATSTGISNSVIPSERSESRDPSSAGQHNQIERDSWTPARNTASSSLGMTSNAQLAAYSEFEKTANAELEKSVGGAIERALRQALPLSDATPQRGAAQAGVPTLQERLGDAVRKEIEKALQGDRQLGEQVAQILSARRFDDASRAQVVRVIGERAGQLVPGATKRVLQDWTQTTLAAHRSRADKQEEAKVHFDLAPVREPREIPRLQTGKSSQPSARNDSVAGRGGRIDYKKLSDEQILNL